MALSSGRLNYFGMDGHTKVCDYLNRNTALAESITKAIKLADEQDFSYSQIYTALHKMIDLAMTSHELYRDGMGGNV